jgi:hypothetical protein
MKRGLRLIPLLLIPLAAVLLLEGILQITVGSLPMPARNLLLTGYRESPAGIYAWNPKLEIRIMKPDFQRSLFFNGGRWEHRTNGLGIRDDREFEAADIILLGDSMVYGHMVEVEDTFARRLEEMSGLTVANLGMQGDYPPTQYLRMRYLGLFLRPSTVLFFINDWQDEDDFMIYRPSRGDIRRIIQAPPPDYSKGVGNHAKMAYYQVRDPAFTDWLEDQYTWRTWKFLRKLAGELAARHLWSGKDDLDEYRILARDHLGRILLAADRSCRANGARLMVISHHNFTRRTDAHSFKDWCGKFCREKGIPFLDLRYNSPKNAYYIRDDGHYSPEGHTWVAHTLLQYLKRNSGPAPGAGEEP